MDKSETFWLITSYIQAGYITDPRVRNRAVRVNGHVALTRKIIHKSILTFGPHTNAKALFQSTFLTFSSHIHINITMVSIFTLVNGVFCNTSSEEPFAAFAGERVIMVSGGAISAHQAQLLLLSGGGCGSFLLFGRVAAHIHQIAILTGRWKVFATYDKRR